MSEKIVQLNEEVIKGAAQRAGSRQRKGNSQRAAGSRSGEVDPGSPVRV